MSVFPVETPEKLRIVNAKGPNAAFKYVAGSTIKVGAPLKASELAKLVRDGYEIEFAEQEVEEVATEVNESPDGDDE
jgi:hypothetical protein